MTRPDSSSAALPTIQSIRWIISEPEDRWFYAVRRFCSDLTGDSVQHLVERCPAETNHPIIKDDSALVLLWEVNRGNLVDCLDQIIANSWALPNCLQMVACSEISSSQRLSLSQLQIGCFLSKPEELAKCEPILHGYFAKIGRLLN